MCKYVLVSNLSQRIKRDTTRQTFLPCNAGGQGKVMLALGLSLLGCDAGDGPYQTRQTSKNRQKMGAAVRHVPDTPILQNGCLTFFAIPSWPYGAF